MAQGKKGRTQARIHPAIPAGLAVVVCGLLIALVANAGDDDAPPTALPSSTSTSPTTTSEPEPTSTTTTVPPEPVALEALLENRFAEDAPAAYRVTYELVESELPRTEEWTVRRPYESLVVSTRDGEITTATATSREALWTYLSDREAWLQLQPELHRAAFDLRPAPNLGPMVALGLAEPGGTAEYLGRSCRVFTTGAPSGASVPTAPSAEETTELCIDDAGLILHERWSLDGRTVTERTAVAVDLDPTIDGAVFTPSPEVEDAEQYEALLGQVAVPADDEVQARLASDIVVPAGWQVDGVVLRTATPGQSGVSSATEVIRFVSDGVDLVEYAEVFGDGPVDLGGGAAVPVESAELERETWFVPGLRDAAVQVRLTASSYAELRGTDPVLLFDLARSLTLR